MKMDNAQGNVSGLRCAVVITPALVGSVVQFLKGFNFNWDLTSIGIHIQLEALLGAFGFGVL